MPEKSLAELEGLLAHIDEAATLAQDPGSCKARIEAVSAWGVQDHLEHLMLTDTTILLRLHGALDGTLKTTESGRPTPVGYVVILTGFIPRGRGRAPDFTRPNRRSRSDIEAGFAEARERAEELRPRLVDLARHSGRWRHPSLGAYTLAQWLRFAHIHHRHHAKVIADIVNSKTP